MINYLCIICARDVRWCTKLLGDSLLKTGVSVIPIEKQAASITLAAQTKLAGMRFHPAVGFDVLGKRYEKTTFLEPEQEESSAFYMLFDKLKLEPSDEKKCTYSMIGWLNILTLKKSFTSLCSKCWT